MTTLKKEPKLKRLMIYCRDSEGHNFSYGATVHNINEGIAYILIAFSNRIKSEGLLKIENFDNKSLKISFSEDRFVNCKFVFEV